MKIAMIGQKGIPTLFGGVERHVEEISCRLADKGYQVFAYVRPYYTSRKKKKYHKVELIHLPAWQNKFLDTPLHVISSIFHAAFKLKPEVLHFHGIGPALFIGLAKIITPKTKIVFTFHCRDYFHKKWGFFSRLILRTGEWMGCNLADEILAVSPELQKYIWKNYKKESLLASHGVQEEKVLAPQILSSMKKDSYLLAVTRLIPHKGIHYLIQAYQKIETDKKLVIAGDSFHTEAYQERLHELAKNHPNIIFLGNQKGRRLKELYSNAYLYVHPSEQEGLPLTVLEAASFGLPMLLSNIPEHKSILDSIPLFFKNKDVADLRKKLEFALNHPKEMKQKGKLTKKEAQKRYNWDQTVEAAISSYVA